VIDARLLPALLDLTNQLKRAPAGRTNKHKKVLTDAAKE